MSWPKAKCCLTASALALLDISKTTARDALNVLGQVQAQVKAETDRLPSGIKLSLTQDAASVARGRLNLLVTNGLQGLALVFAILWLFFSMRYGFWVAMGLPVSFLGGLFVLGLMGVSLNMISMVGLLIAVGLLMDDAIVIAEKRGTGTERWRERYRSRDERRARYTQSI